MDKGIFRRAYIIEDDIQANTTTRADCLSQFLFVWGGQICTMTKSAYLTPLVTQYYPFLHLASKFYVRLYDVFNRQKSFVFKYA